MYWYQVKVKNFVLKGWILPPKDKDLCHCLPNISSAGGTLVVVCGVTLYLNKKQDTSFSTLPLMLSSLLS